MMIGLPHYLFIGTTLFFLGLMGAFISHRLLSSLLISFQIILLGVIVNLVAFSSFLNNLKGQWFAFLLLLGACAEIAIGLSLILATFKQKKTVPGHHQRVLKE